MKEPVTVHRYQPLAKASIELLITVPSPPPDDVPVAPVFKLNQALSALTALSERDKAIQGEPDLVLAYTENE